jgi:hypothetical protein
MARKPGGRATKKPTSEQTCTVGLMGTTDMTVEVEQGATCKSVLEAAAKKAGVTLNLDRIGVIKNGKQVDVDEPVMPGDIVSAATNTYNG